MKKKIELGKKLFLNKKKLDELNEAQMAHFLGGRMAAATTYTSGEGGPCQITETCFKS